jgi:hypothetical protein
MHAQSKRPVPHFVTFAQFTRELGLYHKLATHLIELGVLEPSGYLNGIPIFLADVETIEKARNAVSQFRSSLNRAHQNLRELSHA